LSSAYSRFTKVDLHRCKANSASLTILFPLLCLPSELLSSIVSNCLKRDPKSLRLSCKTLEVIPSEFLHEVVYLDLLPESFDQLNAISNHGKFSSSVRTILYYPERFLKYDSVDSFKNKCIRALRDQSYDLKQDSVANKLQMWDDEWLNHYNDHESHPESQEALVRGEQPRTLLLRIVAKFPTLNSVVMTQSLNCNGPGAIIVAHSSMRKAMQKTLLGPALIARGFYRKNVELVLSAASNANIKLKHAWFDSMAEDFFDPVNK
jgi:hypothetical protein